MGMKTLLINNLSKRYQPNLPLAIDDISIYAEEGEIVGLVGKNGAGKSTLIKSFTGIHPFDSGEIHVCGHDMSISPIDVKKEIGYVPDVANLFEKMTGLEYINFIANIFKVPLEKRQKNIDFLNGMIKLNEKINNQISTYSHGMKQKIAIIAALVHEPNLFVLDEPLTGLDPQTVSVVKRLMVDVKSKNKTVIFSSHNLDVVEKICDRVYIINNGKVVKEIDLNELRTGNKSLEEYFIQNVMD